MAFDLFSDEHVFALVTGFAFMVGGCLFPLVFERLNVGVVTRRTKLSVTRVLAVRVAADGSVIDALGYEVLEREEESRTPVVVSPPAMPRRAGELESSRRPSARATGAGSSAEPMDDQSKLILLGLGVLLLAALYLRYYVVAVVVVGSVIGVGIAFSVAVMAYLLNRHVIVGRLWALLLIGSLVVMAVGLLTLWLLTHPSWHGGGRYSDLFVEARRLGFGAVIGKHGLNLVVFILYQLIGLLFFVAAAFILITAVGMLLALTCLKLGARPRPLWRTVAKIDRWLWWVRRPGAALLVAMLFALASGLLTSGVVYNLVGHPTIRLPSGGQLQGVQLRRTGRRLDVFWKLTRPGRLRLVVEERSSGHWHVENRVSRKVTVRTGSVRVFIRRDHREPSRGQYRLTVSARTDAGGAMGPPITRRFRVRKNHS